jgi:hypothetical protein
VVGIGVSLWLSTLHIMLPVAAGPSSPKPGVFCVTADVSVAVLVLLTSRPTFLLYPGLRPARDLNDPLADVSLPRS